MSDPDQNEEQKMADVTATEGKETATVENTVISSECGVNPELHSAVKLDTSTVEPPSDLEQKIIKQVEFYYGDINLARDKFLQEQIKLDDGWVTLEVMLRFNRLKSLTTDETVVAAALRKSTSGLMEVDADGKKIRRSVTKPLSEMSKEHQDSMKLRYIYAKGFPLDSDLDSLMAFFEKFGTTELVLMRRNKKKEFKGSCFVVFRADETAKKFLETPDVKYGDVTLLREYRHDYYQRKIAEKKQQAAEKAQKKTQMQTKDDRSADTQDVESRMVKGAILLVKNLPDDVTIETVRSTFSEFGEVKWVDINKSEAEARVRFSGTDGARFALEKADESVGGIIKVEDVEVNCSVLGGDEEIKHWQDIFSVKKEKHKNIAGKDKKKRSGGRRRDHPQRKKAKSEAVKEDDDDDDVADDNADSD